LVAGTRLIIERRKSIVGSNPTRPTINKHMKLELTSQRLIANRTNGIKGGQARQRLQQEKYLANPAFCTHCNIMLPQEKKNNKFCSRSCSASFNNTVSPKRVAKIHNCPQCNTETKVADGKYCSAECHNIHRRKYKTPEDQKIATRKKVREVSANYRAKIRNQTPLDADRKAIKEFYDNCMPGYEIDHIIPISKGGLHTLENLQYLTIRENRQKSNKLL
jgi:5-methylcytosine-specific restriction endonuclease McrA